MYELEAPSATELEAVAAVDAMRCTVRFINAENATGPDIAASLLQQPPETWLRYARSIREQFSFGALVYLLQVAHDELDRDAQRACRLSVIVARYARTVDVPKGSHFATLIRGRAWKEYSSALHSMGRFGAAWNATARAIAIFSTDASLLVERTSALALRARIGYQMGRTAEAVTLLRECNAAFQRFGEDRRALQVAIMESIIIYHSGDVPAARSAFLVARAVAERLEDLRELSRIKNNLAQCEAKLGNFDQALVHLRAAQQGFDQLGMTAERQRALWIEARILRDTGRLADAVAQLLQVRRELIARGMIVQAAYTGLDLLELLAAIDERADLERVATELVAVFTAAGMSRDARVALAYLADQARMDATATTLQDDLRRVRTFFRKLETTPNATFTLPTPH
jgi:tetratricopeptide (TPR) repeat protein